MMAIINARTVWIVVLCQVCLTFPVGHAEAASGPFPAKGLMEKEAAVVEALSIAEAKLRQAISAGQIRMVFNGEEVSLAEPILRQDGRLLIPIREIAAKRYSSLIHVGDGTFRLIAPDGQAREVRATVIDQEPVITEEELKAYFSLQTSFDEAHNAFYVWTPTAPPFHTSFIEKPQEELAHEAALRELITQTRQAEEELTSIPEAARPSVQLRGQVAYTYSEPHAAPPFHNLVTSVTGRVLDFNVRGESVRKDINGVFQHDYSYLNLSKPGLFIGLFDQSTDLFPLRAQSQAFNGAKVIKDWGGGRYTTTLAGGETENTVSGPAGSTKYLGRLFEIREGVRPTDWLRLKTGLLYLDNEADLPERAGTTSFPRSNLIAFSGMDLTLPRDLTVSANLAHAQYKPDNERQTLAGDWNWRTSADWKRERYGLGFDYEFVGDQYASLGNPASYQDYQGWTLHGYLRPTDRWSLSSNLLRYRNNVDRNPARVTTENQSFSLSSGYRLTDDQSINLSFSQTIANPFGPEPGSSSRSALYRVDYFRPFLLGTRLLTSYQYFRNKATVAADSSSHTVGGSLFKSYGKGSSWYFSPEVIRTFHEGDNDDISFTTSFNLDHHLTRDLSLYLNSSYARDKTDQARARNTFSGSSGLRAKLLRDTALNVEYSIASYDPKVERRRWPRHWAILLYVSQSFGISTPPAFGRLEGWVFEDLNGNGMRDASEPSVADALVRLADAHREATTDAQGYFTFPRVVPGTQTVQLDLSSLDPRWALRDPRRAVDIRRRKTASLSFPLVQAASLRGHVFIDQNQDLVFQTTEEPLENVAVILVPGNQARRTNADGEFQFESLLPGHYTVQMFTGDVPRGYELASSESVELELLPGEEAQEVNFAVRLLQAPGTQ